MSTDPTAVEHELGSDLAKLGERYRDDEFCTELYRALANNRWHKKGGPEGHVAKSWSRAENLVNQLRAQHGAEPLTLAQSGGEGEVSQLVGEELERLGWSARALDTSSHDDQHVGRPQSPPPPGAGEAGSPTEDSHEWERRAHAEAEQSRNR
jgi:hypothetical protein